MLKYLYYIVTELFPLRRVNFKAIKNKNSPIQHRQDKSMLSQLEIKIVSPNSGDVIKVAVFFQSF